MKFEYQFTVEGHSENKRDFIEKGSGALIENVEAFDNEARLHFHMLTEALETFIAVTQKVKDYKGITELKVTIKDIRKLK